MANNQDTGDRDDAKKNNDHTEDIENDELDEEDEDFDDENDEHESDEDSDDDEDSDIEDDKPVTGKDLKKMQKRLLGSVNASLRHAIKDNRPVRKPNNYQPKRSEVGKGKYDSEIARLNYDNDVREVADELGAPTKDIRRIMKDLSKDIPGISPRSILRSPHLRSAVKAEIERRNVEAGIPTGGAAHSVTVEGKTYEQMKPEERRKSFAAIQEGILKSKGRR